MRPGASPVVDLDPHRHEKGEGHIHGDRGSEGHPFRGGDDAAHRSEKRRDDITSQADRGGDGISGEREHSGPGTGDPEPHRLPRPLRDLVEHGAYAQFVQGSRHQIQFSHRHATAENQHVVRFEVEFQPLPQFVRVVDDVIVSHTLKPVAAQCSHDGVRVRAPYLMRQDRFAGLDQLVASGDHRQHRLAADPHPRHSRRGGDCNFRRAQLDARSQQQRALA